MSMMYHLLLILRASFDLLVFKYPNQGGTVAKILTEVKYHKPVSSHWPRSESGSYDQRWSVRRRMHWWRQAQ